MFKKFRWFTIEEVKLVCYITDIVLIINSKIFSGTFGTVYEARVGATKFALKLGNNSKEPLDKEVFKSNY